MNLKTILCLRVFWVTQAVGELVMLPNYQQMYRWPEWVEMLQSEFSWFIAGIFTVCYLFSLISPSCLSRAAGWVPQKLCSPAVTPFGSWRRVGATEAAIVQIQGGVVAHHNSADNELRTDAERAEMAAGPRVEDVWLFICCLRVFLPPFCGGLWKWVSEVTADI